MAWLHTRVRTGPRAHVGHVRGPCAWAMCGDVVVAVLSVIFRAEA
jgi:hypothetical protein